MSLLLLKLDDDELTVAKYLKKNKKPSLHDPANYNFEVGEPTKFVSPTDQDRLTHPKYKNYAPCYFCGIIRHNNIFFLNSVTKCESESLRQ